MFGQETNEILNSTLSLINVLAFSLYFICLLFEGKPSAHDTSQIKKIENEPLAEMEWILLLL